MSHRQIVFWHVIIVGMFVLFLFLLATGRLPAEHRAPASGRLYPPMYPAPWEEANN